MTKTVRFPLVFALTIAVLFAALSLHAVNDRVVEPLTEAITGVAGAGLRFFVPDLQVRGTALRTPTFAVNVRNGCNGLEALTLYLAAVLAFPASWSARGLGVLLGLVVIPLVNQLRVMALVLVGLHLPELFDTAHTVIAQSAVILAALALWLLWAARFAAATPPSSPSKETRS